MVALVKRKGRIHRKKATLLSNASPREANRRAADLPRKRIGLMII